MSRTKIKFDSEMSWPEYREYYKENIDAFGAPDAWEHYFLMRWQYVNKMRPFADVTEAYMAIPAESNPYKFNPE